MPPGFFIRSLINTLCNFWQDCTLFYFNDIRQTGVAPDNLKYEEDTFHKIEMDLVRGLRRVFRKGKGFSFQHIGQILSPRTAGLSGHNKKPVSPSSTLPRNRLVS